METINTNVNKPAAVPMSGTDLKKLEQKSKTSAAKPAPAKTPVKSAAKKTAATKTATKSKPNPALNAKDNNAEKTFDAPLGHVAVTHAECNEKLLQGIYQTTSMFLSSADALKPKIKDKKLQDTIKLENEGIDNIADKAAQRLRTLKVEPKQPSIFTRASAWMGVQFNSLISSDNRHIAEMMIEGCTMGIYGCIENIYDYQKADKEIKDMCENLMHLLEKYLNSMKYFLTH